MNPVSVFTIVFDMIHGLIGMMNQCIQTDAMVRCLILQQQKEFIAADAGSETEWFNGLFEQPG